MTGTIRSCVNSVLRAALTLALWTSAANGESRPPRQHSRSSVDTFSAALSDDPPPAQYGSYQYVDSPSRSQRGYGFQFADPEPNPPPDQAGRPGGDASVGRQTDVQQVQYPLGNETFDASGNPDAGPLSTPPSVVPPLLGPAIPSAPLREDGWGFQSEFQSDLTHVFGSGNSLGITTWTGRLVMETSRLPGVSVRPHFGWHLLNGPGRTDLPAQLYDASIEARMYWPFHDRIIGEFALAPSVFSDFQNTSGDALRIVGRGVGYFLWSPDVKFAAGATYLDRKDIQVLPIAGVIWTPTPDHRLELLFPQPRIAHRYHEDAHHERWVYLSGEFGGGSWAIERSNGMDDVVSYRDWRLITGIEWKYRDKSSWRIEGGYVFGRELEYVSRIGDYEPAGTTMVRAALVY
ncbi:MAG: hypothetical protein AB7U20_13150 [Planctomycetaceae bacterium]